MKTDGERNENDSRTSTCKDLVLARCGDVDLRASPDDLQMGMQADGSPTETQPRDQLPHRVPLFQIDELPKIHAVHNDSET